MHCCYYKCLENFLPKDLISRTPIKKGLHTHRALQKKLTGSCNSVNHNPMHKKNPKNKTKTTTNQLTNQQKNNSQKNFLPLQLGEYFKKSF